MRGAETVRTLMQRRGQWILESPGTAVPAHAATYLSPTECIDDRSHAIPASPPTSRRESRRAAFGTSVVTPAEQLYVRNNLPPPDASMVADRDGWKVAIEGVRTPSI